ncbi:hypothetical protein EDC04DRAFT_1241183 [Pisolithus marmoratus]|nr:hypothetical protein EDC04DRAFT_1241183 [Pisolithus marmoratus]
MSLTCTKYSSSLRPYRGFLSVDRGSDHWGSRYRASDHVTNLNVPLSSTHSRLLPRYAIEQSSGYPQENGNIPTFEDLDYYSSAGPTMDLDSISPFHDHLSGQEIDTNTSRFWLSSPLLPSHWGLPLSDELEGDSPPPPDPNRDGSSSPVSFSPTMQLIKQTHLPAPFSYTSPTPSRSNSKFYPTADDYTSCYPPILMPNQISSSLSSQEHLGHLFPGHPYHTRPADLSDFLEFRTGSKMEPHSTSTVDSRTAHVPSDCPPPSPSGHRAHPFGNHATYILDYPPAGGGVDDYGNLDKFQS